MKSARPLLGIVGRMVRHGVGLLVASSALLCVGMNSAMAVPSFARQTGQECAACHVGAYGPQLTPYGVKFKIGGYTDSDGKDGKVPISAMVVAGLTHTGKSLPEPLPDHVQHGNDNLNFNEASVFFAGRLMDKVGAFVQATYDGVSHGTSLDQADVRLANSVSIGGKDVVLGLSLNNNPGLQDPFNALPVWGFPYVGSAVGFNGPSSATMFNGGLEHRVLGVSGYAFIDNSLYAELGTYRALSPTMQARTGQGRDGDMGSLGGTSYWRLAWMQDWKKQNFSAGIFGFDTRIQPERLSANPTNNFKDLGVDASYQFLGNRQHVGTIYTSWIRERQTRNDLVANGGADNLRGTLNEFRINASYYYNQTWGLSAGAFSTRGSSDPTLYSAEDGYANGSPDTSGKVIQLDWTPWGKEGSWGAPWANLRVGLQYTMFDKFNGASRDYDGNGRDAKDNNTLFLFLWSSF